MSVNAQKRRELRRIAHTLSPVVMISENGCSEGAVKELNRALQDHELIKVKLAHPDREERHRLAGELCTLTQCECIQKIGKILILYRASAQPDPRLSNILRAQAGKG